MILFNYPPMHSGDNVKRAASVFKRIHETEIIEVKDKFGNYRCSYHLNGPADDTQLSEYIELMKNRLYIVANLIGVVADLKETTEPISTDRFGWLTKMIKKDRKYFDSRKQRLLIYNARSDEVFHDLMKKCFDVPNLKDERLFSFGGFCDIDDLVIDVAERTQEYAKNIKTKGQLDAYKVATKFFKDVFHIDIINNLGQKFWKKQLEILDITENDINLHNFDLKNTKDIKYCKALYPLAKQHPDLFYGWYDNNGDILFEPTYSNGLEKKRKELHAKIEDKKAKTKSAFKRGVLNFAAKVIVPEKLREGNAKFEQKVADVVYRKQRQGRK